MSSFPIYVPQPKNPPENQLSSEQKEYLQVLEEYRALIGSPNRQAYEAAHQKLFDYERRLRQIGRAIPVGYGGKSKRKSRMKKSKRGKPKNKTRSR